MKPTLFVAIALICFAMALSAPAPILPIVFSGTAGTLALPTIALGTAGTALSVSQAAALLGGAKLIGAVALANNAQRQKQNKKHF